MSLYIDIEKNSISKQKEEFENNGFTTFESILTEENISNLKLAIKKCSVREDVDQYKDRHGLLRRMENFTFKNTVLRDLNKN